MLVERGKELNPLPEIEPGPLDLSLPPRPFVLRPPNDEITHQDLKELATAAERIPALGALAILILLMVSNRRGSRRDFLRILTALGIAMEANACALLPTQTPEAKPIPLALEWESATDLETLHSYRIRTLNRLKKPTLSYFCKLFGLKKRGPSDQYSGKTPIYGFQEDKGLNVDKLAKNQVVQYLNHLLITRATARSWEKTIYLVIPTLYEEEVILLPDQQLFSPTDVGATQFFRSLTHEPIHAIAEKALLPEGAAYPWTSTLKEAIFKTLPPELHQENIEAIHLTATDGFNVWVKIEGKTGEFVALHDFDEAAVVWVATKDPG